MDLIRNAHVLDHLMAYGKIVNVALYSIIFAASRLQLTVNIS
jgi:hypothetical protein